MTDCPLCGRGIPPIFFVKIDEPAGDDVAYARRILRDWGKDTDLAPRPNMKLLDANGEEIQP